MQRGVVLQRAFACCALLLALASGQAQAAASIDTTLLTVDQANATFTLSGVPLNYTGLVATLCSQQCNISAPPSPSLSRPPSPVVKRRLYQRPHRHSRRLHQSTANTTATFADNTTTLATRTYYVSCPLTTTSGICLFSVSANVTNGTVPVLQANVSIVSVQRSYIAVLFATSNASLTDATASGLKLQVASTLQAQLLKVPGTINVTVTPESESTSSAGRRRRSMLQSSPGLLLVFGVTTITSDVNSYNAGYASLVNSINSDALSLMPFLASYGITGATAKTYNATTPLSSVFANATQELQQLRNQLNASSDDDDDDNKKALAIGLGVGLGGAALLAGIVGLVVFMRRKEQGVAPRAEEQRQ